MSTVRDASVRLNILPPDRGVLDRWKGELAKTFDTKMVDDFSRRVQSTLREMGSSFDRLSRGGQLDALNQALERILERQREITQGADQMAAAFSRFGRTAEGVLKGIGGGPGQIGGVIGETRGVLREFEGITRGAGEVGSFLEGAQKFMGRRGGLLGKAAGGLKRIGGFKPSRSPAGLILAALFASMRQIGKEGSEFSTGLTGARGAFSDIQREGISAGFGRTAFRQSIAGLGATDRARAIEQRLAGLGGDGASASDIFEAATERAGGFDTNKVSFLENLLSPNDRANLQRRNQFVGQSGIEALQQEKAELQEKVRLNQELLGIQQQQSREAIRAADAAVRQVERTEKMLELEKKRVESQQASLGRLDASQQQELIRIAQRQQQNLPLSGGEVEFIERFGGSQFAEIAQQNRLGRGGGLATANRLNALGIGNLFGEQSRLTGVLDVQTGGLGVEGFRKEVEAFNRNIEKGLRDMTTDLNSMNATIISETVKVSEAIVNETIKNQQRLRD